MALPEPKETLVSEREKIPIVERPVTPEVPLEVEHAEAVTGAEISLPQPVTDDTGQVIVDDAQPKRVKITLPLTEAEMKKGLHYKIIDSLRWLAEWCLRLVKIAHGKFVYRGAKR